MSIDAVDQDLSNDMGFTQKYEQILLGRNSKVPALCQALGHHTSQSARIGAPILPSESVALYLAGRIPPAARTWAMATRPCAGSCARSLMRAHQRSSCKRSTC